MLRSGILGGIVALGCLLGTAGTAAAAQPESISCFCGAAGEDLRGICLRRLPEEGLYLGRRLLQPGDVLTAEQAARVTFSPAPSPLTRTVEVGYLPIGADCPGEETVLTLSVPGKTDKAPVAEDSALETYQNLENTGRLKATDPEGEALTYTLTRQPRRGTVELLPDGSFTYTPKKNKVGIDSFVYTASDPAGNVSREATVTVTILKSATDDRYADTQGRSCRFSAEWMRQTGIFTGESLGRCSCFSPDRPVTRGEFVTMLVKALEIPVEEELVYTGSDGEIPVWLQPYLAAALRSGLTEGLEPDFAADAAISGAEAARMLENALDAPAAEAFAQLTEAPLTREAAANALYLAAG